MLGLGISLWSPGSSGSSLLAAPAAPVLTLISGASENVPVLQAAFDGALATNTPTRFKYATLSDFSNATDFVGTIAAPFPTFSPLADGPWYFRVDIEQVGHAVSRSNVVNETIDATAPVLSSPSGTQTGSTTATLSVTTNEVGTLYVVAVLASDTAPTAAQIKLGHNHADTAAVFAVTQGVISTGAQATSATGLSAGTSYKAYSVEVDGAGNTSNVAASGSFPTASAAWTVPTSGLTHWWKMDDANISGTDVIDSIGSITGAIDGTVTSATGPGAPGPAQAREVTSSGDINLGGGGATPIPDLTAAYSVALRVYVADLSQTGSSGSSPRFFDLGDNTHALFLFRPNSPGGGAFTVISEAGNLRIDSSVSLTANTWHRVVWTYNGAGVGKLYLDGVDVTSVGTPVSGFNNNIQALFIGEGLGIGQLLARICDFAVWNRALSAGEA